MKIALIGYGKMGKAIEGVALANMHQVALIIDADNVHDFNQEKFNEIDVAIEFTTPQSAVTNIKKCLQMGVPVISGTTGWLEQEQEIKDLCNNVNGTLLYASNFSIGVNVFFELNKYLAKLMQQQTSYNVSMEEVHHTQKKDAPSGTAITLATDILNNSILKKNWVNETTDNKENLEIISKRIDPHAGTHSIKYQSNDDKIEIIHTAHNRNGFATGAVLAAEFIHNKKGIFTMKNVLGL